MPTGALVSANAGIHFIGTLTAAQAREGGRTLNVTDDLLGFTGLSPPDMMKRLRREGVFHFESEHAFWHPENARELRWYYQTSVNYMFANAIHKPAVHVIGSMTPESGPVLDFSGGVGNNVIALAKRRIASAYTGIGLFEFNFARYRVRRRKLEALVEFIEPYSNFQLDPLAALSPPRQYGCILAFDVLEHIPHFEATVQAMVRAVRPGGCICESSPFSSAKYDKQGEDTRVHLTNNGISMQKAMGPSMSMVAFDKGQFSAKGFGNCWWKKRV